MNRPAKLLLAGCIASAYGTLSANELDEITMVVIDSSDITADDIAQTIELPSIDELKATMAQSVDKKRVKGEIQQVRQQSIQGSNH